MKIGWATPFTRHSAIGRFSAEVTEALAAQGHEVSILRTENAEHRQEPHWDTALPVLDATEAIASGKIRKFDSVVVNVGDNYAYHEGIFDVMDAAPAVGIFHDWCIINLFWGWRQALQKQEESAIIVERLYGEEAARRFHAGDSSRLFDDALEFFPMTEWVAEKLDGAVAHAGSYLGRLSSCCPGPAVKLPLAYTARGVGTAPKPGSEPRIVLVTVGVANPNKRIESVLGALGGLPEWRDRFLYRVVGPVDPGIRAHLEKVAANAGVKNFEMTGRVTSEDLVRHLDGADIVCCLRFPSPEGASASCIESMQYGKPVLVTDVGFYGELPDDLVLKVDPQLEIADIRRYLVRLAESADERVRLGQAAQSWAAREFHPQHYARQITDHLARVTKVQPVLRTAETLGAILGGFGLEASDPALERVSAMARALWKL